MLLNPLDLLFETAAQSEQRERDRDAAVRVVHAEGDPPVYRCRVCGHEAPEPRFCMTCLADTMVPVARVLPGPR